MKCVGDKFACNMNCVVCVMPRLCKCREREKKIPRVREKKTQQNKIYIERESCNKVHCLYILYISIFNNEFMCTLDELKSLKYMVRAFAWIVMFITRQNRTACFSFNPSVHSQTIK